MRDAVAARAALAAVLVVILSLIASATPVRADMALPSLVPGSRWSYAYGQYSRSGGNLTSRGTGTYVLEDLGPANVTEGGATYLSDHLKLFFNFTFQSGTVNATLTATGDMYYRQSDLATVQAILRLPFGGSTFVATTSYAPPLAVQWPLVAGANWTSSSQVTSTSSSGGPPSTSVSNVSVDYRVGATAPRTVPAGTFATTPLNGTQTNGSYTLQYWSPSVRLWIEQDIWTNSTLEQFLLVSYRNGPANTPPNANFVWSPSGGDTTTVFTFTSTSSDAQDPASALRVRWDWENDGTWDTGWSANATATHTFTAPGVYNVTLEVMDTGGLTANRTQQVTVTAANPLVLPVLGLPLYAWLIVAAAVAALGVAYVLLLRRRARVPPPPPPISPPPAP